MGNLRDNNKRAVCEQIQKPVNVPVARPLVSVYTTALHMSFIAFALVASIFVIAFATFSSANAFSIEHNAALGKSTGYAAMGSQNHVLGLLADQPKKYVLPNVEETAFNSMILWQTKGQAKQIKSKPLSPRAFQIVATDPKSTVSARSPFSTMRALTIGILGSIFAFMIWITARMWREFAGSSSLNGRN